MNGNKKVAKSYNEMRQIAANKDLYIMTAFYFFVGITKRDLKLAIGNNKFVYYLDVYDHSVYIIKMTRQRK